MQSDTRTILIAEDEDINFLYIKEVLKNLNFNILRAHNGLDAINLCRSNDNIVLVLMDIKMPLLNGLEATKEIRKFNKNLPIIAQTAFALVEDKRRSKEFGCNDYISKPFTREDLIRLVKKYINV